MTGDADRRVMRDASLAAARDASPVVARPAIPQIARPATAPDAHRIVAGIGFASAATGLDIASLVRECLDGRAAASLAVPASRAARAAAREAAAMLGLALVAVPDAAIARVQDRCLSRPSRAAHAVAEGAALAVAGDGAALLGPRRKGTRVTCALAAGPTGAARATITAVALE